MDMRYQKIRDKDDDKLKTEGKEAAASSPSAPSASSSPSHEFSFTISVHPPATTTTADEIFFHGHLLPLHLLSHLPVSPRSSTNSMDSFTLPIKELPEDQHRSQNKETMCNNLNSENNNDDYHNDHDNHQAKGRGKPKSFSLFGLPKWKKGCDVQEKEGEIRQKRKLKIDISHLLKRYFRMVRQPLLSLRKSRANMDFQRQSHSYSGNLSFRCKNKELRGRRGEYSAPASIWTSPTNSGHLVATGTLPTSTSDSTMEELQAAIQAAIAHCKNSIAVEDKKQQHHD